ncbi:helix-turn-helix domain-containing protein [Confluentibacter sediminis]|uniref:helix-turn-helix domain-containing protein n=1 Tax=Confluentibacter sediminis TaxID=2219045 RepID=UPI001C72C294|nr:helix-turn-helix transcriptional regulator [Confluentibacter sediminis]
MSELNRYQTFDDFLNLIKIINMNSIGTKILEIRKSKGLTQEELVELSKVNLRTIQRIEK